MHFLLAAALSVVFAAIVVAAPAMDIKARQIVTFGDDGRPSMSGAGGQVVPYSNAGN